MEDGAALQSLPSEYLPSVILSLPLYASFYILSYFLDIATQIISLYVSGGATGKRGNSGLLLVAWFKQSVSAPTQEVFRTASIVCAS